MEYSIRSSRLFVSVSEKGAQLTHVILDGKERLWQNDDGSWPKHAPILFPVCGHFGVTVDGKSYPIRSHGFASRSVFTLAERTPDTVKMTLVDNDETREVYPYAFTFSVIYHVEDTTLSVTYEITAGDAPLPFACGGHESFRLDGEVGDFVLHFPAPEHLVHLMHDDAGYLTGEQVDYGTTDTLPLPGDFLLEGRTLVFSSIASREATLTRADGTPVARVTFPDFPNLLLWHPGTSRMLCIEPWLNLPDPAGVPDGEFSEKPGVEIVPPSSTRTLTRTVTYF